MQGIDYKTIIKAHHIPSFEAFERTPERKESDGKVLGVE